MPDDAENLRRVLEPADAPPAPPALPADPLAADKTKRVDELSALSRSAWFTLLGVLAFLSVTLLSITHADLLLGSRKIELPLVAVEVPTTLFLRLAPVVVAILYVNLHLYLGKLWHAFRYAPADNGSWRLADHIQPWLVNDYALTLKDGCRPRGGRRRYLRNALTLVTAWLAAPVVLAWIWRASLPARDWWTTGPILASLAVVLAIGAHTWLDAHRELTGAARLPRFWKRPRVFWNLGTLAVALCLAAALVATVAALDPRRLGENRLAAALQRPGVASYLQVPIDIERLDLVGLPDNWRSAAEARGGFRRAWCELEGLPLEICGTVPAETNLATNQLLLERQNFCRDVLKIPGLLGERKCDAHFADVDRRFDGDWADARRTAVGKLPRLDLSGERLAGASAREATLIGGRLEGTDLSGATLSDARAEGAILIGADLRGASAWYADLGHGNLTRADLGRLPNPPGTLGADGRLDPWRETNLTDANLEGAILVGATLQGAWLTHANLVGANLRGADLRGAHLQRARLHRVDLTGAILSGADLRYATGLTQAQLDRAIGDDTTLFTPPLALTPSRTYPERHFQVPDCWTSEAIKLAELFGDAPTEPAARFRCPEGRQPTLRGRTLGVLPHNETALDHRPPVEALEEAAAR